MNIITVDRTELTGIVYGYERQNNSNEANVKETHTFFGAVPTVSQFKAIVRKMDEAAEPTVAFHQMVLESGELTASVMIGDTMYPLGKQRLDHTPIEMLAIGDMVVSATLRNGVITQISKSEYADDYLIHIDWAAEINLRSSSQVHHHQAGAITLVNSPGYVDDGGKIPCLLEYRLIKTVKRLTFDIIRQDESVTYKGAPDSGGVEFTASNGFTVISENRMDLDTRRVWLHGSCTDQTSVRSGTKVFDCDENRDIAFNNYVQAINEWAEYNGGYATLIEV